MLCKIFSVAAVVVVTIVAYLAKKYGNSVLMKFFRDLSRYKARKRLYGNDVALVPILFHQEQPIDLSHYIDKSPSADDYFTLTLDELKEMDGRTPLTPMYVSVKELIFDVSAALDIYGPGHAYHSLVGRNATLAFANACVEEECFHNTDGLTTEDYEDVDRWVEFYYSHDKYKFVGRLVHNPIDSILDSDDKRSNPIDS